MCWTFKKDSLLIVVAIVLAVGLSGRYVMSGENPQANAPKQIQLNIVAIDDLKLRIDLLKNTAYMHIANAEFDKMDERKASIEKLTKDVDQSFAAYEKLVIDDKDRQFLDNDRKTFYPFISILSEVIELSQENEQKDNALTLARTKLQAASDNVTAALRGHIDYTLDKAWRESHNETLHANTKAAHRWWWF